MAACVVIVVVVVVAVFGLVAQQRILDSPPTVHLDDVSQTSCSAGAGSIAPDEGSPIAAAIDALAAARESEQRCKIANYTALCRGLWAAWVLDPVLVGARAPELAVDAAEISQWALARAEEAAVDRSDRELATALATLGALNEQLASESLNDQERSNLLIARADPTLVDVLAVAEVAC